MSEITLNCDEYRCVSVSSAETTSWGQIHFHDPRKCDFHSPLDVPKLVLNGGVFGVLKITETFWRYRDTVNQVLHMLEISLRFLVNLSSNDMHAINSTSASKYLLWCTRSMIFLQPIKVWISALNLPFQISLIFSHFNVLFPNIFLVHLLKNRGLYITLKL